MTANRPSSACRTSSSSTSWRSTHGWVAPLPIVGDLVISIDPTNGKGHHIGICTETNPFTTIAGNTSEDGKSREGTGVFEHEMTMRNKVFVRLP
jgi:hypothetical protein